LVTFLKLGTNYKIALHEQVDAIEQERGAIMETRETMFFYISENENRTLEFFDWSFFSDCTRPRAVTTSLKVYSLKLLHGNNSSIKTCIFVNNTVVMILQVN